MQNGLSVKSVVEVKMDILTKIKVFQLLFSVCLTLQVSRDLKYNNAGFSYQGAK